MKLDKSLKRLLIFAVAAFMVLSAVSVVSAEFFDFEADDGGWVPTASWDPVGDWEWTDSYDVSNYVGDNTPPPTAYSGDGLWGTIIYDDYTNSGGETYLSQTFDFSSVAPADATLSFYSWEDAFGSWDYCYVNVNGNEEYYSEDYSPTAWKYVELDLSAYAGMSSVEIVFGMHASTVVNYSGWYIDDISISGEGPEPDESGNDCSDPITVEVPGDLEFQDLEQTTCGKVDDYSSTDMSPYDYDEDIIYELDVTEDTTIIVDMDPKGTTWAGIGLFDDCPDVGTLLASKDYSDVGYDGFAHLGFSYDVLAAESPYYIMIDSYLASGYCIPDFDLTISMPQSDTGVSDIIHPADGDGTDPVPVEVEVTNYGSEDETAVPVHVIIEHEEGGGMMLEEGFEGSFPPAGWTIETYDGTTYEWEQWEYSDTSYTYEPPGTGDYYAVAQDDETPSGTDVNTGLFTPSMDMTGLADVYLEFEQCFQDFAGYGEAEVRSYSGGVLEEVLLFQTDDGPYNGEHTTLNFDPSGYTDPSDVQIEFWYTDDYYDTGAWGFAIDDVEVWSPSTMVTDYDETVNIDILAGETITVDTFPDWTGMSGGIYNVQACTELATDSDTSNDCMEKLGVMIGLIDTGVTAINFPQALMGPVPFSPNATVENFGDFDMNSVPVHAWIEGGSEVLKLSEDFESMAGFNSISAELAAESDIDTHTGEGAVKLVGDTKSLKQLHAFSDWTVLDLDGDGTTWHQTDYNACEGMYSAYHGVEGVGYNSDSVDWLISPPISVGAGGRIEFEVDYDIESYYDYLFVGNSANGVDFYGTIYDGNSGGCITVDQQLYESYIAGDGTTYVCFMFSSDFMVDYEGAFVDNVNVYGSATVYDQTVNVDIPVGSPVDVVFPEFNPPDAADYTINICTEHPVDENTANDCQDLSFTTNAPVYIEETGLGYAEIQPAIDAAENGQTVVVTDGTFTEDLVIDKPITVTGELGDETEYDENMCSWDLDHETFLQGTVYIEGTEEVAPPAPEDCEYEICLEDDFGDGWNGGSVDVVVDGITVLDDITLASGSGPECFTFTVEDGSSIEVLYTPGSWAYENFFSIYDSEGNTVVANYYPDDSGDWSGTASCPAPGGIVMDTIFENFDVNPPNVFTDHEAAVQVGGSNVIVQQNTIHNVRGMVESDMFTIKGIHIYNGDSSANSTGIVIQNNTIRDILNENMTGGGFSATTVLDEGFEDSFPPTGWTLESKETSTDPWTQTSTTVHTGSYAAQANYGSYSERPIDEWLITPTLDLSDGDGELTFWRLFDAGSASYPDEFEVLLSEDDGATWPHTLMHLDYNDPDDPDFVEVTIDLSSYTSATTKIAFRYWSDWGYSSYIDDVLVTTADGGPGPGPSTYGGATGIMVQGFLDEVTVENNRIEDIHSAGWCYGVEYTPTNIPSFAGRDEVLNEDFEGGTIPGTWSTSTLDTSETWEVDTRMVGNGVYSADVWWSYNQQDEWLMTPTLDLSDGGGSLEFISAFMGANDPDFQWVEHDYVKISTDGGSTWTEITDLPHDNPNEQSGVYQSYSYDLDPYVSPGDNNVVIGFHRVTPDGGSAAWGIDDVKVYSTGGGGGDVQDKDITINCNYFREIGDGSMYDVFNNTGKAPYPGVMFTVDEAPIPGPADASVVTLKCNYFDPDCMEPVWAVINKDLDHPLDATMNYWGSPKGPNGGVQDPVTGYVADGFGAHIVDVGPVMFDAWLGIHANIEKPMNDITVEAGEAVHFDAEGSYAYIFDGCGECCNPEQESLQYLWDFGDGLMSTVPATTHVFTSPGVYEVSLMVDAFGFPYHNNFMYEWDYVEVTVTDPGEPLNANADGENLGGYETNVKEPVTLYGAATGGESPYYYSWDFGDGTSSETSSKNAGTVTHTYIEEGTYTVTLTVIDSNGDTVTDTSIVEVYGIEELVVSMQGSSHVAEGDATSFTSMVTGGCKPYSYQWNFGDGVVSNLANPTHVYENSGTYTVTLTVTDASGSQETESRTITVGQTDTSEVEINNVKAGLLLSATIDSDEEVSWSIDVEGIVLFGGHADGTAVGSTQVRLPFSLGFGKVDITITAGSAQEQYTATMIGPFLFNLQEA